MCRHRRPSWSTACSPTRFSSASISPPLERLATSAASVDLPAGVRVVAEGDIGTDYFLVIDGSLTVCRADVTMNQLGAGDSFGERSP